MKLITLIPIFILLSSIFFGIGSEQSAYVLNKWHLLTGAIVLLGSWWLGYLAGDLED